ncbi:hypothetical protein Ade02nite_29580 [Paractinoplanes deccanensis]|uniref:Uncharacterized protein n=1 Tax=Paractinoplanes deccanensis TaxID=113561 RepID=A0ABQ3Y2Z0_9ACTN|nr:hypothetical protein [Actinoplanes deccanensis]GID74317.1 hypothetical protein Ade02nite_29580 [Actinoplanes deccanensis]
MNADDLDRRRAAIRQRQLLLALEQWGPSYVGRITKASEEELAWLKRQKAPAGPARSAAEWNEIRREQGRQANAAASAAFGAGDYARARDLVDEARAYGAVLETEWQRLHEFIDAKAGPEAPPRPEPGPDVRAAA